PFWSFDSRSLGFFAGGKLKKIEVSGGSPVSLCDASSLPNSSGAWSRDGMIVFAARSGPGPLQKVSSAGCGPTRAPLLRQGELGHTRPFFLPDGRHFLFAGGPPAGRIYVASLDSSERKLLLNSDSSNVVYSQGHLLFLRETTLMARPFDARRLALTGEPFP